MEAELNSLEAKVAQFVAICERLRAENIALRQELAAARNDAKRLNDKIADLKLIAAMRPVLEQHVRPDLITGAVALMKKDLQAQLRRAR